MDWKREAVRWRRAFWALSDENGHIEKPRKRKSTTKKRKDTKKRKSALRKSKQYSLF